MEKKLVYIKWMDATTPQVSWFNEQELLAWADRDNYSVESVGWLFKETKNYICLVGEISHTETAGEDHIAYARMMKIPKGWIIKRETLKIRPS